MQGKDRRNEYIFFMNMNMYTACRTWVVGVSKRFKLAGLVVLLLAFTSGMWMLYIVSDKSLAARTSMYKVAQTPHKLLSKGTDMMPEADVQIEQPDSNRSDIILRRRDVLRSGCQRLHGKNHQFLTNANFRLNNFIYNDKYNVVLCYIQKVACTNLKRTFMVLEGKLKQTDPTKIVPLHAHTQESKYLRFLSNLKSKADVMYRLKHYKKVIVVREPFERLLSAWRNKIETDEDREFARRFGPNIVRRFRKNATKESLEKGHDVLFREFIQYLIKLDDEKQIFEPHWEKYTELCHPCEVEYDFIGKYDTLDEDMDFLLNDIGVSSVLQFPRRTETYKLAKTADILINYYNDIPKAQLKRVKDIFANDSFLFDFRTPSPIRTILESDLIR